MKNTLEDSFLYLYDSNEEHLYSNKRKLKFSSLHFLIIILLLNIGFYLFFIFILFPLANTPSPVQYKIKTVTEEVIKTVEIPKEKIITTIETKRIPYPLPIKIPVPMIKTVDNPVIIPELKIITVPIVQTKTVEIPVERIKTVIEYVEIPSPKETSVIEYRTKEIPYYVTKERIIETPVLIPYPKLIPVPQIIKETRIVENKIPFPVIVPVEKRIETPVVTLVKVPVIKIVKVFLPSLKKEEIKTISLSQNYPVSNATYPSFSISQYDIPNSTINAVIKGYLKEAENTYTVSVISPYLSQNTRYRTEIEGCIFIGNTRDNEAILTGYSEKEIKIQVGKQIELIKEN